MSRQARVWGAVGLVVIAAGIAIRVSNVVHFPPLFGFDAKSHWRYMTYLTHAWVLPHPEFDWSTSHPPLFYYMGAAVRRLAGDVPRATAAAWVRAIGTLAGLGIVALAVALVRQAEPGNPRRAVLAAGLLLFLPVHIYMSAMVNEEILAAFFTSAALFGAAVAMRRPASGGVRAAIAVGLAAGLAWMTKLSGVLVLGAVSGAYLIDGWRRGALRSACVRVAVVVAVASSVGGWYYARNWVSYGYLYPQDLRKHQVMFSMKPGERSLTDYVYVPVATWTDPQLLAPDLLRSVWGSTYVTLWFDGHRQFVPREEPAANRFGTAILLLGLVPMAALAAGMARGLRRTLRSAGTEDLPLLLLTATSLAGYVVFTWGNPWFVTLKAAYLLGLCLPFAYYASDTLSRWSGRSRGAAITVGVVLAALAGLVAAAFTYGLIFEIEADKLGLPFREWTER